MNATVFLGPSMPLREALMLLPDATYRPPAAQQDLIEAITEDGAQIVGLIDGTFHQTLSVWHSEVCYLLSRGISVFGASSMGALRAAETEKFGTVGVGTVFEWYRDGVIAGDDEVALVHGDEEAEFAPMSLVLVNIRASIDHAVLNGCLGASYGRQVIELARSLYYPDRQLHTIIRACRSRNMPDKVVRAVEHALTDNHVDVKRADARALLLRIRDVLSGSIKRPPQVRFDFSSSGVFEALYNLDRHIQVSDTHVSLRTIREHASLHNRDFKRVRRAALDRSVVTYFGSLLGIRVTPEQVESQRAEFLQQQGLRKEGDIRDWLERNGMTAADLTEYLTEEALCQRLRRWVMSARGMDRGCRALLDEARMTGVFPDWAAQASEEEAIVNAFQDQPEYRAMGQKDPRWLAALHLANTDVCIDGDARVWAEDAGFEDVADLNEGLRRSAIFYDVRARISRQIEAMKALTGCANDREVDRARSVRPPGEAADARSDGPV